VIRALLLGLGTLGLSLFLTRYLIGYTWRRGRLDLPNERSSHSAPTPRGGGVAVVAGFTLSSAYIALLVAQPERMLFACLPASLAIAAVGWWDDRRGLSARLRFSVHLLASVGAALCVNHVFGSLGDLAILGSALSIAAATLFLAWMINLYNFMDGIDGLAGGEAVSVALVSGALVTFHSGGILASVYLCLALASAGFLAFNWPPAKIFMGDVASGFLGFVFGTLALVGEASGTLPLPVSLILLGTFVVDASWTLGARTLAGEKPWVAHRDHAYQHAAHSGLGHRSVSLANLAINLIWLTPLAVLALHHREYAYAILAAAYFPLLGIEIKFRAGIREATG
jgi:Fuc2NAc and GlcNAc transferase